MSSARRLPALFGCLVLFAPALAFAEADGTVAADVRCEQHALSYEKFAERFRAGVAGESLKREVDYHSHAAPTPAQTREYENAKKDRDTRKPIPPEAYDELFHGAFDCRRLRYWSDGLQVIAYALRPSAAAEKRPVIVFLRGGNRDLGLVDEELMQGFFLPFLRAGYAVIAPQYRGADGGEGKDEFGGADLRDVLNLVPLVRAQAWADVDELFLYGASRGGMEGWLALRAGFPVRAAVIHAGPTDLEAETQARPEMERIWRALVPGYAEHPQEFFESRSARRWVSEIHTPVLILQGTADWRVAPVESLAMATRLQELGRDYGLVMYPGDDHALTQNREDALHRSILWFAAHAKKRP